MSMPRYAQDAIRNQGQNNFSFGPSFGSGLASFISGLSGDAGEPYHQGIDQLNHFYNESRQYQNPFLSMGQNAIPQLQQWLQGQQNPSGFINNLMSQYHESPWAKYQQDQAMRAGMNTASASGLMGSTPFLQQAQQNASNISSQDMQQWLANVLGINTQYGQGLGNMVTGGQNAANSLSNLSGTMGENMANLAYGQSQAERQQDNDLWGGLFKIGTSLFGL